MFAARLLLSHQTAIRPIRQALTPLESALPQNQTCHFVTPIESTPFFRISSLCTKLAPVTPVSTTLTNTASCNPIRMNTSEKHPEGPNRQHLANHSSTITYPKTNTSWSDHFTHIPAPNSRQLFSSTSSTSFTSFRSSTQPETHTSQRSRSTEHGLIPSPPSHFALCNFHGIIEGYACR